MQIFSIKNLSFGTQHIDISEKNYGAKNTPLLNHSTAFFRYGDIDEFICNLLKEKGSNRQLNILSAGCSYGEEVYSLAMGLVDLKIKPKITGIDISSQTIEEAKKGEYILDINEIKLLETEELLSFNKPRTDYDDKLKLEFHKHFKLINPNLSQYRKKENAFKNCDFELLNILHLKDKFEENSQDAILCRYVLYHLKNQDLENFFTQVYSILKPDGLFCIEPFGYYHYQSLLTNLGFEQPYKEAPCIFRKPKHKINFGEICKQFTIKPFESSLNNESYFNNIQQGFEENLFAHF